MEVSNYIRALRKWTWLLVLCSLVTATAGYMISSRTAPVYEARASILIRPAQALASPEVAGTLLTADQISRTYAALLVQRPILTTVINDLHLRTTPEELLRQLTVTQEPNTTILTVADQNTNRRRARDIVNALVNDFVAQTNRAQQQQSDEYVSRIQTQVVDLEVAIERKQVRMDDLNTTAERRRLTPDEQAELSALQSQLNADQAHYSDLVRNLSDIQAQHARLSDSVSVVSPAYLPDRPVSLRPWVVALLAAFAGLTLAIGVALVLDRLDQSIESDDEMTRRTGLITLGQIGLTAAKKGRVGELVALGDRFNMVEGFKSLRTNLLFSSLDHQVNSIVVTSPSAGEGKSRTSANLAVVLAQAGHRTVLVDADFRRPSQHRIFRRIRNVGLSNLILQDEPEEACIQAVSGVPNLFVVTSGTQPPNPSELLGSSHMRALHARLRHDFAYVVWDTPPVNAVTDATVLAASADAAILIIEHRKTTFPSLIHAKRGLDRVGAHVLGVVVNKVRSSREAYYYYYDNREAASEADQAAMRQQVSVEVGERS
jgi:capsular exopolysaccharide synthesis family protein